MNEDLAPAQQAAMCEHGALTLLDGEEPSRVAVAEAQALATLGQSLRLRGCEEWLDAINRDGIGVG